MNISRRLLDLLPVFVREQILKRHELTKFAMVGGTCWVLTAIINYLLKLTILQHKPVVALSIATLVASFVSYALNRDWTFRTRGGLRRHHELTLYIAINGIGIVLNSAPLFIARNAFHLRAPNISTAMQEISDFTWGMIVGTLIATAFRMWAYRRWVFPHEGARLREPTAPRRAALEPEAPPR